MKTTLHLLFVSAALGLFGCASSTSFAPLAVPPVSAVARIEVGRRPTWGGESSTIADPAVIAQIIDRLDHMKGPANAIQPVVGESGFDLRSSLTLTFIGYGPFPKEYPNVLSWIELGPESISSPGAGDRDIPKAQMTALYALLGVPMTPTSGLAAGPKS